MAEKKNYKIDDHFPNGYDNSRHLFELFSNKLQSSDSRITEEPKKLYIGFKLNNKVVVAVRVQKSKLVLELYRVEPENLQDPRHEVRYKENSFEDFNKHVSLFNILNESDVDYALSLSRQVVDKFFN